MANEKLDLIDRHALLENSDVFTMHTKEYGSIEVIPVDAVGDAPTVDAVPVVHGRWVLQRYYGGMRKGMVSRIICSECGYPNEKTNYCPHCGAKTDGGNEDG